MHLHPKAMRTLNVVSEWSEDILLLAEEFRNDGVVGIDIAGNEAHSEEGRLGSDPKILNSHREVAEYFHSDNLGEMDQKDWEVFEKAEKMGIHRTVHAGEAGSANMIAMVFTPSNSPSRFHLQASCISSYPCTARH